MALEINEVGIRMRVRDARDEQEKKEAAEKEDKTEGTCCASLDRAQVVEDCVQRVLKLLKAQRER